MVIRYKGKQSAIRQRMISKVKGNNKRKIPLNLEGV